MMHRPLTAHDTADLLDRIDRLEAEVDALRARLDSGDTPSFTAKCSAVVAAIHRWHAEHGRHVYAPYYWLAGELPWSRRAHRRVRELLVENGRLAVVVDRRECGHPEIWYRLRGNLEKLNRWPNVFYR